jgi:alpha-ketoglutarate-dependent taurine dioxygenase
MSVDVERDTRAWTAASIDAQERWYCRLPVELVDWLRDFIRARGNEVPVSELRLSEEERRGWQEAVQPVVRDLEEGRGFVIVEGLPIGELSQREAVGIYWLYGQLLGEPFAQNVQGTVLYDVRDTGQDVASGARFSVTSYESSFHTDNSFGDQVLDYVGLLCLKAAKSGGVSQNVSGLAVLEALRREHPDVLDVLSRPMHVDRRGGVQADEAPTVLRPVVADESGEPVLRYLRYWIEVGHEKVGQPLSGEERRALDVLDGVLKRPELQVEFALAPGQMYFINNRWILHNRTAFVDHPELEKRRHLVRLWLRRRTQYSAA